MFYCFIIRLVSMVVVCHLNSLVVVENLDNFVEVLEEFLDSFVEVVLVLDNFVLLLLGCLFYLDPNSRAYKKDIGMKGNNLLHNLHASMVE